MVSVIFLPLSAPRLSTWTRVITSRSPSTLTEVTGFTLPPPQRMAASKFPSSSVTPSQPAPPLGRVNAQWPT